MHRASTSERPRAKWLWLIPIAMLILASLACDDDEYILPPQITKVAADSAHPGQAFAVLDGDRSLPVGDPNGIIYETEDYGQHWQHRTQTYDHVEWNSDPLTMKGETLYLNDRQIWSFPRPTFRQFFEYNDGFDSTFVLPQGDVSNALQGNTLYIAMGTEGVLVGHLDSNLTLTDCYLSANGMSILHPAILTVTQPGSVLLISIVSLFVPPYALLHGFLLYSLWVYLMPRRKARLYTFLTTLGLMFVAAIGATVWLTDMNTDFYPVVAAVSAITVFVGVTLTLVFAAGKPDIPPIKWLVVAAILISLIVPAGVAAIYLGWWAVYVLIFGYIFFRKAFSSYIKPYKKSWRERWLIDQLVLETIMVGMVVVVICIPIGAVSIGFAPIISIAALVAFVYATQRYAVYRLKARAARQEILLLRPPFISIDVIVWMVMSVVASFVTLIAQGLLQSWFIRLAH